MAWGKNDLMIVSDEVDLFFNKRTKQFVFEIGRYRKVLSEVEAKKKFYEIYPKGHGLASWEEMTAHIEDWRKNHKKGGGRS